ncbi:Putative armadillo-like helical domain-containing protein [Septoria linicola]|uniref:Armadillo-like helical domain-containing protein n=1 Tax=Septoria linicola TaxID=215465 RepID=A0A9Q9EGW5_9PEZI|nr:Putative armadillo-like helical domain-containing protein [Septoria linicola]
MEQSPLTQQSRPEVFEPKVVGLYRHLFQGIEEDDKDDEFWTTLFLLKPDIAALREVLENTSAEFLLHAQHQSQQLLLQALARVKAAHSPADENALDTLTVFFAIVLSKKFTNPSSDVIELLAGLDNVDSVFFDLVGTLDHAIKEGRSTELRQKGVRMAIAVVAGGYQTALVSYFVQKDFFPALMKLAHQLDNPLQASEPLLLTGLLANYNKFESNNQYRTRFADFVNEETMTRVIQSVAWTTTVLRERYVAIQDDTPVGWSIGNTLSYVGLGSLAGVKPAAVALTQEQQKEAFSQQPGNETAALLTVYDFALANKLFCHHFVALASAEKGQATPFSAFLSFTSYLYQHAYRNARASLYAYLTLLIILNLVEDPAIAKLLSETTAPVQLCKQRPPQLPLAKGDRPYIATILDLLMDGMNHNLRKNLDTNFYGQSITVLSRVVSYLAKSRTKLSYHWSELWRSLLSFIRFLTTYPDDLQRLPGIFKLIDSLTELLTTALSNGEAFLPDAAAYDDLFYKLVESGEALIKFRNAYALAKADENRSINTLIGVSKHYQELIETQKSKSTHLTPREVSKVIKQGYETLSIETKEGLDQFERYREADHKVALKKIARVAVVDAASLVL